jgi:hypothetical protein
VYKVAGNASKVFLTATFSTYYTFAVDVRS